MTEFFKWCEARVILELDQVKPVVIAAYIEQHTAIRMLFDWLVVGPVVEVKPASSVRSPKYVIKRGKTPVLTADQARVLIDSIETDSMVGLQRLGLGGVRFSGIQFETRD